VWDVPRDFLLVIFVFLTAPQSSNSVLFCAFASPASATFCFSLILLGAITFFLAVAYAPYLPFLGSFGDGVQSLPLDSSPSTRLQPAVPAQQVEQLLETPNSPTCTSFESVVRCPYRLWAIMEFVLVASGDFRCLERLQSALSGRRSCASERLLGASHFSFFFYITRAGVFPHLPEAR
jgi:hypothetical protein